MRRGSTNIVLLLTLSGCLLSGSAYAEAAYAERIREEKEKSGQQISGLDSMIYRPTSVDREALQPMSQLSQPAMPLAPILRSQPQSIGEAYFRGANLPAPERQEPLKTLPAVEARPAVEAEAPATDDVEDEAPRPPRKLGVFDMPEKRPIAISPETQYAVTNRYIPPARLTEPTREPRQPEYVPNNGYWDELNAARERARQAVADSVYQVERNNGPVNWPSNGPRRLSSDIQNDLNQVSAGVSSQSPQQAGLVDLPAAGTRGPSAGEEAIEQELREVEREAGLTGSDRLLSYVDSGGGESQGVGRYGTEEDVPLLRPRRMARRRGSRAAKTASVMERNYYARGSRPDERRDPNTTYAVSGLTDTKPARRGIYRHLKESHRQQVPTAYDFPSLPRGQNVRIHGGGDPE